MEIEHFYMWLVVVERMVILLFLDVLYFPLWWYSGGVVWAFSACVGLVKTGNRNLAPFLWLRYIFVPMYGQYDWQGRLVSFFVRLFNVIGRGIALLAWAFCVGCLFLLWLVFPVAAAWLLLASLL